MVAFATGSWDESKSHGISTMRIDGSDIRAVTHGNDGVPSWSADGRSLYFARLKTDTYGAYCGSIFSVAASGGSLHRITDAEFAHLKSAGTAFQPRAPPAS
jgi:Tol biopolymer transport system component